MGQVEVDQRDGQPVAKDHVARVLAAVADQIGPLPDRVSHANLRPPHIAPDGVIGTLERNLQADLASQRTNLNWIEVPASRAALMTAVCSQ
jgi:hypothetical protein